MVGLSDHVRIRWNTEGSESVGDMCMVGRRHKRPRTVVFKTKILGFIPYH